MADAVLQCPQCGAIMAHHQRGDVVLTRCPECHGVFLGDAELERLIDASDAFGVSAAAVNEIAAAGSYEGRHRRR